MVLGADEGCALFPAISEQGYKRFVCIKCGKIYGCAEKAGEVIGMGAGRII